MKQHMTLIELAKEIERQENGKQDYIIDTRRVRARYSDDRAASLEVDEIGESFAIAETAHNQMAQRLGIPTRYYDRLRNDHPDLLEHHVNELFHREPERRMLRTLDGRARAILSDRFRRLDHVQLIQTVLPIVADAQIDTRASSFSLDSERLTMKLVLPRTEAEVKKGDVVQSALMVTNSEVGLGKLQISPMVYRLVCTNGMIAPESVAQVSRTHRGARHDILGEMMSHKTLDAQDRAFWLEVADVTQATMDPAQFAALVDRMRRSADRTLERDPIEAIERLGSQFKLTESERGGVLGHLVRGGDLSAYGVLNAITRFAQDVESYQRSTELDHIGGQILDMPTSTWRRIAYAA